MRAMTCIGTEPEMSEPDGPYVTSAPGVPVTSYSTVLASLVLRAAAALRAAATFAFARVTSRSSLAAALTTAFVWRISGLVGGAGVLAVGVGAGVVTFA